MDGGMTAMRGTQWFEQTIATLKVMERFLHSNDTQPPTIEEYRLYGMIVRHVRHYIRLFYVEKSSCLPKLLLEAGEGEKTIMLPPISASFGKYSVDQNRWPSSEELNDKLSHIRTGGSTLTKLLSKTRKSLSRLYTHEAKIREGTVEPNGSEDNKRNVNEYYDPFSFNTEPPVAYLGVDGGGYVGVWKTTKERNLFSILQGLEEIGKLCSYSPPTEVEICYYQEIKKRITSCLVFIQAKPIWLCHIREWNLITKQALYSDEWGQFNIYGSSYRTTYLLTGHKLSAALDELPEILSLIKECRSHFSEICSAFYENNKEVEEVVPDDAGIGRGKEEEDHGSKLKLKIKKREQVEERDQEGVILVGNNIEVKIETHEQYLQDILKTNNKTREQYLLDILRVFKKIRSLSSSMNTQLQVMEVRIYAQILEHVISSIWLFRTLPRDLKIRYAESKKKTYNLGEGHSPDSGDCLAAIPAKETTTPVQTTVGEKKTRAEYLQEILLSVEAIKSSFPATPPSSSEMVLYEEIEEHMNKDLLDSKILDQDKGVAECIGTNSSPATANLKHFLKVVQDWELQLFKEMEEEYGEMVKSFCRNMLDADASFDPVEWVGKCYNDRRMTNNVVWELTGILCELPNGLVLVDRLVLVLIKLHKMFDEFLLCLTDANEYMESLLSENMELEAAHEISSALEVRKKTYNLGERHSPDSDDCLSATSAKVTTTHVETTDGEKKTRAEYLQEILLSVEAIKFPFLATPPSSSEMVLYEEIEEHINRDSKFLDQDKGEAECIGTNPSPATVNLKHFLKVVQD